MSNTILNARITDSRVELSNLALLSSGSVNAVQIRCEFCALWEGYTKTAVFYREKKQIYHALISDGLATIPREVLAEEGCVFFGIMGVKENTRTTEAVRLEVVQGAITLATKQTDPTPDIYQQLLASYNSMENALAFERQRIEQLIAMSPAPGTIEYVIGDDIVEGAIRSNGTSAYIEVRARNLNLDQDDYYYSYAVPTHLAPLVPVALDNSISNEMEVSLYVDENGQLILQYHNIKNSAYEFSYIFASATFPLAVVSIPEVIDTRLGANGKTYPTAGDAVRGQIKQTNEKMSAMKKRITNLEQGIIPSPFETDNTVAYHKDVPENVLPYAEVSMVGGVTRKCTNLIPYPYAEMSAFLNGGNMVANEDGSVSFSGTPTSISYLYLYKGVPLKGTVTLSVSGTFRNMRCFLTLKDKNGSVIYDNSAEPSLTCNLNDYPSATTMEVMFIRSSNNVAISGTCYPMLNEGTTVLPYEPYFSGLRSAPVTEIESVGANLIPFKDQEFTLQGVTFKCKNGALIINGTVSGEISSLNVLFKNNLKFELPAGTYSAKSQGATSSCYIRRYSDNTQFALISKSTREAVFTLEEPTELYVSFYMYNQSFNNEDQQIMLNKGSTALPYKPYREPISFPIPSAVQALDGYGEGNPDNAEEYNAIICENGKWKYIHKGDIEDNAWGSLATTEITDISDILSDDNFIGVEAGGTVTMLNEHEYAVPSEITYQIKGANV